MNKKDDEPGFIFTITDKDNKVSKFTCSQIVTNGILILLGLAIVFDFVLKFRDGVS